MQNRDILSYNEYAEIEKSGFSTPYIVELRNDGQHLLFYGSEHTNNPEHPQFNDVEERWNRFISNVIQPVALVEGHFDEVSKSDTKDKTKAIVDGGEAQFVVYLARKDNVEVTSPEPDRAWEANQLANEFGRDNVAFYYFVRQIGWWNRFTKKPDVQVEAAKMLALMKITYSWDDVVFSTERMMEIHQVLFDKPLSWDDTQWVYDITTPTPQDHVTNKLARRSGELRDEYILKQIVDYWQSGKSPFIVFGSAHAIRLEPALRKLGEN